MTFARAGTAVSDGTVSTYAVSLVSGWDEIPEGRPPAAGDIVVLVFVKPESGITGPPDWEAGDGGRVFFKVIGPRETHAVFSAHAPEGWEVRGRAYWAGKPWPEDG